MTKERPPTDDHEIGYCALHWCPDTSKNPCKRCNAMDRRREEQKDRDRERP